MGPDGDGAYGAFEPAAAYNSITEQVLEAIVKEAQGHQLPVVGHVPRSMTMTRAVEIGLLGLEHVRFTAKELLPKNEAAKIDIIPYTKIN